MNKNKKQCSQHDICEGSDSYLPMCECWCAECKEIMADIREALKNGNSWPHLFGLVR